jgi:hypothetical protein
VGDLVFFPGRRRDTTDCVPVCRCHELTAGVCSVCAERLAAKPPTPTVSVTLDAQALETIQAAVRAELARILREAASKEAGPVGERLRQIADVFEVTDGGTG